MRILFLVPIVALAACGGGETKNQGKAKAQSLEPGQYEVTAEVTQFRAADEGTPKIDTPVGTRTTRSVCVPAGGTLPPDLFADEGFACESAGSSYARGGTMNLQTRCTREGLSGSTSYSVNGTFEAQSFEAERQLSTLLNGDGDVVVTSRVQGRRTGECTPGAAPAGNGAAPKGASR
jgi:hypothetical protein